MNHDIYSYLRSPEIMAVSGNSSDSSPSVSLTAKTPIFGLKLYIVIVVTIVSLIAIFVLIFLFIRSNRKSKSLQMRVKHSSGFLPLVCKEISEISDSDHKKGREIVEFERKENESIVICSVKVPKISGTKDSCSNESSTSQSEASTLSAEGLNVGWGRWYSLKELEVATNGFSVGNVIGEGGYGIVYRGVLLDGSVVAVKNLLNNK